MPTQTRRKAVQAYCCPACGRASSFTLIQATLHQTEVQQVGPGRWRRTYDAPRRLDAILPLVMVCEECCLPVVPRQPTTKDYLDFQEATALIQAQARFVLTFQEGTFKRAEEERNLAMVCLGIATGRRRHSLLTARVAALDLERCEYRVDWEKGKAGRVLPVAKWAVDVCRIYLNARGVLLAGRPDKGYLFPGGMNDTVAPCSFYGVLQRMHRRAVAENPDLEAFAEKHLSPHSLRVSFATLLFKGGCNIRSINELMLHSSLSTTARYTPIPLEDLRRVCRMAHPRA